VQNLLQHVSNIANSGRNPHQQEKNGENDGVNGCEDQNNGVRIIREMLRIIWRYNMIITGLVKMHEGDDTVVR
jgi:hypothetical protein